MPRVRGSLMTDIGSSMTTRGNARPAFAVVRVDWFHEAARGFRDGSGPNIGAGPIDVTIKEIVLSESEARAEVERLNALNAAKGCRYYWQQTRLFSDGGSFGAEERSTSDQ
jgi:hypothetical protein